MSESGHNELVKYATFIPPDFHGIRNLNICRKISDGLSCRYILVGFRNSV